MTSHPPYTYREQFAGVAEQERVLCAVNSPTEPNQGGEVEHDDCPKCRERDDESHARLSHTSRRQRAREHEEHVADDAADSEGAIGGGVAGVGLDDGGWSVKDRAHPQRYDNKQREQLRSVY